MSQLNAQIHIENLRLRTYIGFNETEKQNKQDVMINVWADYCASEANQSDDIDKAVNYHPLCKKIINHVENNCFLLLEKLTSEVLSLCSSTNKVTAAKVIIRKPHALRFADSVSLTLSTQRDA